LKNFSPKEGGERVSASPGGKREEELMNVAREGENIVFKKKKRTFIPF